MSALASPFTETCLNGSVLELLEACVLLQAFGEELGPLIPNVVVEEAASKSRSCVSVMHQCQWALTRTADSLQRGDRSAGRQPARDLLGTSWAYLAACQAQGGQLVALLLNAHNAESCLLSQLVVADTVCGATRVSGR